MKMLVAIFLILIFISIKYVFLDNHFEDFYKNLGWQLNLWRLEHLESTCKRLGMSNMSRPSIKQLDHIIVDHNHKLLYCYVPKVACTNWKRIIIMLSGKWKNTNISSITGSEAHDLKNLIRLSDLPETQAEHLLNNYTRFLFVRHPFERLLSAYRNKLEDHKHESAKYFQARIGKHIIKNYRSDPSERALEHGNDVTFLEFAQYLLNEGHNNTHVNNEHWRPISQLCYPCALTYHVIGKYETLLADSDMILNMLNVFNLTFPEVRGTAQTREKLPNYFKQLPLTMIEKLFEFYKIDFELFQYNLQHIIGFDIG